ncbi:MAG: hypothetical protein KF845_12455 [Cyclobacteriaceae bacterium]|nr:hypothetical protein [Cyclobacteriaceae bacterium]
MSKKLEEFVQANRQAFDDRKPSERVWKNVSRKLFGSQTSASLIFWRAAAVFFMALSAYLLYPRLAPGADNQVALKELQDVEKFYFREIADKVEMIESYHGEPNLNGFTNDFKQLEAMYEVLKEEMRIRPSKKVKEALVLNLLIRIDLLNQQLYKLDQQDEGESKTDTKV